MFPLLKKRYIISFLLFGLILFICYLMAGILGECFNAGVPPAQAAGSVLTTPFSNHFNDFTPVLLLFGIIIFEFGWFLKNTSGVPNEGKPDIAKEDKKEAAVPNYGEEPDLDDDEEVPSNTASSVSSSKDIDITKFGFVIPDDVAEVPPENTDKEEKDKDAGYSELPDTDEEELSEDLLSFSSDIFWVLNGDYTPEQIREMVRLKRYIKNLDAAVLRRTFKPTLSAAEIREYIELFYG